MKQFKHFQILTLLLLAVVKGAWAQTVYEVGSEAALRAALDADITWMTVKMTDDIQLNSRLVISEKNVTLDLNGKKLWRSLTTPVADGNVILVEMSSVLFVQDSSEGKTGQISGGKAVNGGGICNHGYLYMEGGTITNCYATDCGGGIFNAPITPNAEYFPLLVIRGGVVNINDNRCDDRGGGIYNYPGCDLSMEGSINISSNSKGDPVNGDSNNVYLDGETVINVTNTLYDCRIGISVAEKVRTITSNYNTTNPSLNPASVFYGDDNRFGIYHNIEAIYSALSTFNVRSWDDTNKKVVTTQVTKPGILLDGSHPDDWIGLGDGYYIVKNKVEYLALNITGTDVHLVLDNGAELKCKHIKLEEEHNLFIYSQGDESVQGKLTVENRDDSGDHIFKDAAALGGGKGMSMGNLYVHGGNILARGAENDVFLANTNSGAAIGGGYYGGIGSVVIFGGNIKAYGSHMGAGIGGGMDSNQGGPITIYGGNVQAEAGAAAAIGGGFGGSGGVVKIYGGRVDANYDTSNIYKFTNGAGIGGGEAGDGCQLYIYGGETYAYARGISNPAVGGSSKGKGGTLEMQGGYLYAEGWQNAVIGGGYSGDGGTVNITGGTIFAVKNFDDPERLAKNKCPIIGGGEDKPKGTLYITPGLMVSYGDADAAYDYIEHDNDEDYLTPVENVDERRAACQSTTNACVLIKACDHVADHIYTYIDDNTHANICKRCAHYDVENHTYGGDNTCACGKKNDATEQYYTLTIHTTTDGTTYSSQELKVVQGKDFVLPMPQTLSGLTFMGYLKAASAEGIEMKDSEEESLLDGGKTITPEADATYYARYRYVYDEEWTWNAERTEATVKITNSLINDVQTLNAAIDEDTDQRVEPSETTVGERFFTAAAYYNHSTGVTYPFYGYATLEFNAQVALDAQSTDNTNTVTLTTYNGIKSDVTFSGYTLKKDGDWNTLCLPFSIDDISTTQLAGATVKEMDNSETGTTLSDEGTLTLKFKDATSIQAGKAYIIKWAKAAGYDSNPAEYDVANPEFKGVIIKNIIPTETTSKDGNVKFVGQYAPFNITDENINQVLYVASGNKIGYASKARTLKCFRAHFRVKPTINGEQAVNVINIDFGDATGIISIHGAQDTVHGEDGAWYTLDGRKLNSNRKKGVYINNSKKVVIY